MTKTTILKAISNEHRLQIIDVLKNGEFDVATINRVVKLSQPALSRHLGKMRRAGIVTARRHQRQIFYSLKNAHVLRIIGIAEEMSNAGQCFNGSVHL